MAEQKSVKGKSHLTFLNEFNSLNDFLKVAKQLMNKLCIHNNM